MSSIAFGGIVRSSIQKGWNRPTIQKYTTATLLGSVVTSLCQNNDQQIMRTKCEGDGSVWDLFLPKNSDGTVNWGKASNQVVDNIFWDKIGKAAGSQVQGAIDSGIPTQLSYGFISGYCSGIALKKVGKAVSVVFGLGFISLQTLAYYGYVKVDQSQIQKDFNNMLDINDDGVIDAKDGEIVYNKVMKVLQYNMPAGSGFAAGFVGGLRSG